MHRDLVLNKLSEILSATDDTYENQLTQLLDQSGRIFVAGAGRSGLIARFFVMRLMHAGYEAFLVGEVVTPSVRDSDTLILISGSGGTEQLVAFANRARKIGAKIALVTAKVDSALGDIADQVFEVGKPDLYGTVVGMPMGTVFELSTLIFLEAQISHLIHEKGIPEEEMRGRHANLE
ncbi:MAG: 6-phospho-3-hexuloisomerase [Gammaproteobacteria bacterium]|nr:6-phospho-3-hexuloisomerase [Gammaproteobacteria bacterium]